MEDILHEHRAPWIVFSWAALSQIHCMAPCLPQEQVAFCAQTHSSLPSLRPQQVVGLTIFGWVRIGVGSLKIQVVGGIGFNKGC